MKITEKWILELEYVTMPTINFNIFNKNIQNLQYKIQNISEMWYWNIVKTNIK